MVFLRILLEAVIYLLVQIFVLQNLTLGGLAVPKGLIALFIFLPMTVNLPIGMLYCFVVGLLADIFILPYGAHAFTAVLIFALRGFWAQAITSSANTELDDSLDLGREAQSFGWLLSYVLPLVFVYELVYNILVDYTLNTHTLLEILSSGLYSTAVCILLALLVYRRTG